MLFDTHAHLDDEQLIDRLDEVITGARDHDCLHIVTVATSLDSSRRCIEIAESYPEVLASVGIHPNSCHEAGESDWGQIERLCSHPRVVALGESGLDSYWQLCPMLLQREFFARHIRLSHEAGLPFIVHMRDCQDELIEFLQQFTVSGSLNGILHSFTGTWSAAEQCLQWGMYISFAGMVTYKKNDQLREVARQVPADRLLVETDSPYLTPHPVRGQKPNQPSLVRYTLQCLAEVRGATFDELASQTTANAMRIFDRNLNSQR